MRILLAVAVFGALGAALRLTVGMRLAPSDPAAFPWATFVCNNVGSFLLGLWYGYGRHPVPKLWKEAIGTGLIGSFTTFSAFSLETIELLRSGHAATALTYVLSSLIFGILLAWTGSRLLRGKEVKKCLK